MSLLSDKLVINEAVPTKNVHRLLQPTKQVEIPPEKINSKDGIYLLKTVIK